MGSHRHRRRSNLTEGIEALRVKYGIPGTIIAVSSRDENVTESLSFGIANTRGDSVTEDVGIDRS